MTTVEQTPEQIGREIEQVRAQLAALQAQPQNSSPEWEIPSHQEINLATVEPEELGLDPFNTDDPLVKAIYKAQADPYPYVPAELKRRSRWLTWSGDPIKKQPFISGTSTPAATNKPEHLVSYELAVKNIQRGSGHPHLGFVPENPVVGLDLDSCRNPETGSVQEWASELLRLLPATYVEITPSQTGLRAWVKISGLGKKKVFSIKQELAAVASKAPQVETLVNNYGTITGQRYNDAPAVVAEIDEQQWSTIEELLVQYARPESVRQSSDGEFNEPPVDISVDGGQIPRGQHDKTLFKIASSLRQRDWDRQQALEHLFAVCEARCVNYGPDYRDMCEKKIESAWKYEVKPVGKLVFPEPSVAQPVAQTQTQGRVLNFVRGDSIKPKRLQWLWNNRILADKLNVFSGEPDVGKGMTTVDFAARITRRWDFPDCKNELDGPRDVLFLSSEDDMEDTIIPRLKVAGADMTRIHFAEISDNSSGTLTEGIVCLDRDLPVLEEMIRKHPDIVLIIPDPVIAFLGDADPNKDKDVRPIYSKMKSFAKRLNVAWLFVNHWNKNQNASSINRTSGAKTMVSAPRATWMFSKSPEDPTRYLMMKGKGNLSSLKGAKTLAYRITGERYDFGDGKPPGEVPKLVWDGETEHSTEDVLQDQVDPTKRRNSKAEDLLVKLLDGCRARQGRVSGSG